MRSLLFILSSFSLLFFNNCSKQEFSGIDAAMKLSTMENHPGLMNSPRQDFDEGLSSNGTRQFDNGFGSNGQVNTDGGLGMGGQNSDGGLGMGGQNSDGGFGTGGQNSDSGIAGGRIVNRDDGLGMGGQNSDGGVTGGTPQNDGGSTGTPNYDNGDGKTYGGADANRSFDSGGDTVTDAKNGVFNVIRWCRGRDEGTTLKQASSVKIQVVDGEKVICSDSGANLLSEIVDSGKLTVKGCDFSNVSNDKLRVLVTNEKGEDLGDGIFTGNRRFDFPITQYGQDGQITGYEEFRGINSFRDDKVQSEDDQRRFIVAGLHLLFDKNIDEPEKSNEKVGGDCDAYNQSPLVVDMRSASELKTIFSLSNPASGILFDIEGLNAKPVANTPKRISWMKDPRIMPIVLPKNSDVNSVDQMFGNNTLGPDNDFSDNGFTALAKYDGFNFLTREKVDPDGVIDKDDAVYSKLRLWYDMDLDGKVDRQELIPLSLAKVEIIDLRYDKNFYSDDKYGNQIKYQSVAKLKGNIYKPIFDIWFVILPHLQKD